MIIKYIHTSEPEREKTYDTEKSLKNNPFIDKTQKEFDEWELEKFKTDKNILFYEVVQGVM